MNKNTYSFVQTWQKKTLLDSLIPSYKEQSVINFFILYRQINRLDHTSIEFKFPNGLFCRNGITLWKRYFYHIKNKDIPKSKIKCTWRRLQVKWNVTPLIKILRKLYHIYNYSKRKHIKKSLIKWKYSLNIVSYPNIEDILD
jgi:hypothetical protein